MARTRKFKVYLREEQRRRLEAVVHTGRAAAKARLHAQVLLLADEEHPQGRWHDEQIGQALGLHRNTISRVRKRFVLEGEPAALERKRREHPPVAPKLAGEQEAYLIAVCCSPPPVGRTRWTLSLLANELTQRGLVTSISRETVRQALKKTSSNPGNSNGSAFRSGMRRASSPRWKTSSTSIPPPRATRSR